jgi:1,4-dihydroxy-2-naphthoate octaprenyltransferase
MSGAATMVRAWLMMSRVPFHSVGVLPFALGAALAARDGGGISWPVFAIGAFAVVMIMEATYLNGEYHDVAEDAISGRIGKSAFAGGSQAIQRGMVPRGYARIGANVAAALVLAAGLLLTFVFRTGPWTLPLGLIGLASGYFYSARPMRWVERGVGELLIGLCYGWLPIAVGFYLQRGSCDPLILPLAIPVGLSIFNVILINEFPDYPADLASGKRNMTVRLGKGRAAMIYAAATVLQWPGLLLSLAYGLPDQALLWYAPVFLVTLVLLAMVARRRYEDRKALEAICGMTIVVNLATTLGFIVALVRG